MTEAIEGIPVGFLNPMNTAPRDGTPIGVLHKKVNGKANWVGTVRLGRDSDDPNARNHDVIVHYNGDNLITGFRGVYIGWFPLPKITN